MGSAIICACPACTCLRLPAAGRVGKLRQAVVRILREIFHWLFFLFVPGLATALLVRLVAAAARWAMMRRGWLDRVRTRRLDLGRETETFLLALLSLSLLRGYGAFLPLPDWPLYVIFLAWSLRLVGEAHVRFVVLLRPNDTRGLHEAGFFIDKRGPIATRAAAVGLAVCAYFLIAPLHALLDKITTSLLQAASRLAS